MTQPIEESEKNETTEESTSLEFLLAIAGRLDAQGRLLAKDLHEGREIYYIYAVVDSLSSSYSMFKYVFDMSVGPGNNNDLMHDFMQTPAGIAGICSETVFLVGFSVLACLFENEKDDQIKKFIADAWPYFRDVLKALKNAYKGSRSAIQAAGFLGGTDLTFLVLPVGLSLGIIAALNRLWLRYMVEDRKDMMKANGALLKEIKQFDSLHSEEVYNFLNRIQHQSAESRIMSYACVSIGGLVDGLYLYVGVLGLTILAYPIFVMLAVSCFFYTVACIVTRVYEEYDFQQRLFISQTKCNLALLTRELKAAYNDLNKALAKMPSQDVMENAVLANNVIKEFSRIFDKFHETRALLDLQTTRTYFTATLLGVRNGLYAFGALASVLFLLGSILAMSGTIFPPVLLIIAVGLGTCAMIGFIIHSLYTHYCHMQEKQEKEEVHDRPYESLLNMSSSIRKEHDHPDVLKEEEFKESLHDGLVMNPSPQYFFQEWFEVMRSFFSGIIKGQKFVDFAGIDMQEQGEDGHYHDTPLMYIISFFNALFFAIVLALRALARNLGRAPLGQNDLVDEAAKSTDEQPSAAENKDALVPQKVIEHGFNPAILLNQIFDTVPTPPALKEQPALLENGERFDDDDEEIVDWRRSAASIKRPSSTHPFFAHGQRPSIQSSQSSNDLVSKGIRQHSASTAQGLN